MRTADGTVVEVFEWVSQEAIVGARHNPAVCSHETPSSLPEFQRMFAHFEPV